MISFAPRLVGRFSNAQHASYTVPACTVLLNLRGLISFRIPGFSLSNPGPFLCIVAAGQTIDLSYSPERENWVLYGDTNLIRAGELPGTIELADDEHWINVPAIILLSPELVPSWQQEFLHLADAFRNPVPANFLRIRLGLTSILRAFLDHDRAGSTSPAARLKNLIDDDVACRESLERLSKQCEYHPDHLRELFTSAYGLTPQSYRSRCRLARAMSLISTTGLGVGGIGKRLGFSHVSHFSAFFRQASGMSPRQAFALYRNI